MTIGRLRSLPPTQKIWLIIAVASLARLVFGLTGLGIDESYTVATSRAFHLSTFDHPPVAWWLSWFTQTVFHSDAALVVRLPFIALSGVATWQMYRLTSLLFGVNAGLFAALAFVCAPALGITSGTWVLPDGPLIIGLLAAAICFARLSFETPTRSGLWLAAGFWGGLALLSKYHGIFFFGGVGLFVLTTKPMRRWLLTPWPYLGALIGLAVFSPVLIWNSQHHWVSFAFQGGRVEHTQLHYLKPLQALLGQALFLTPWLWAGLVFVALKATKSGAQDSKRWFLLCLGVPPILLFTAAAAGSASAVMFHWAMPGYLFLLPLFGDWLAQQYATRRVWVERYVIASGAVVAALVVGTVVLWSSPAQFDHDRLVDMRPLDEMNSYLDDHKLSGRADIIIAPTKWHLAGKFDYALKGRERVTCLCTDARGYGLNTPLAEQLGKDFIIPIPVEKAANADKSFAPLFQSVERLDDLTIHHGDAPVESFALFYAKGFSKLP